MGEGRPSITVLIPAHNEEQYICETVRSVLAQTYPAERVVVVDDASSDATAFLAERAGAEVLGVNFRCKAKALNEAIRGATTDLVVNVDADGHLAPDALEIMVDDLLRTGASATAAGVLILPTQEARGGIFVKARMFTYALARRWWWPIQVTLGRISVLPGVCSMFSTKVLKELGGIPEETITEDMDMTWALYALRCKITFSPKATAYTSAPENLAAYVGQIKRWSAGYAQVVRKHRGQLRHPNLAFVVAATAWDVVAGPLIDAYVIYLLITGGGARAAALLGTAGYSVFVLTLASRDLGVRRALKCFLPYLVVGTLDRVVNWWMFIKEWGLGKHLSSWTGRQGRKALTTPMPPGRRRTFSVSALAGVSFLVLVVSAALPLASDAVRRVEVPKILEPVQRIIERGGSALALTKEPSRRLRPEPSSPPSKAEVAAMDFSTEKMEPPSSEETLSQPAPPTPAIGGEVSTPPATSPRPEASPSSSPTASPTPTPSPTEEPEPAPNPTISPTASPTPTPSPTEEPEPAPNPNSTSASMP